MAVIAIGGVWNRIKLNKGIGLRFCQFIAIGIGLPALVIMAQENLIDKSVITLVFGGVFGSVLFKSGSDE
jgi:hypothetical protein